MSNKLEYIERKKLFNPDGNDDDKRIIGGDVTNILDLYNVKYKWAINCWDKMNSNFWLPHKYNMLSDISTYHTLTDIEKEAFLKILSFLIYLDSIQTNNLSNIADYITAPEVVIALIKQQFQEANHSFSYGYILTSIFDKETAMKAIYYWKSDKILLKRNKFIANIYQEFIDTPTTLNYIKVLLGNYLLEGLYFYNGFNFFYNLNSRQLIMDTGTQIKFINRDEKQHCVLFRNIIVTILKENPELKDMFREVAYEMFDIAVEQEITFSNNIIGNNILGFSEESIIDYTKWLANSRLKDIGLDVRYDAPKVNPYKHLEKIASVDDESSVKSNNFETQGLNYKQASILDGWDEI